MRVNNANAFASTFLFFSTHNATVEKIKKSLQTNAPKQSSNGQTNNDRQRTTKA